MTTSMTDDLERRLNEEFPNGYILIADQPLRLVNVKLLELGEWVDRLMEAALDGYRLYREEMEDADG